MAAIDTTLDNIVSHWELEEASGNRVDSHGSNTLSDNNTVTQGTGIQGMCADFESTNKEYLRIADASQTGLDLTGDMSFSFWIKFESVPTSGTLYAIYSKDDLYVNSTGRSYALDIYNNSGTTQLRFFVGSVANPTATQYREYVWNETPSTGVWYHYVFTYDADGTANNRVDFYKDGTDQGNPDSVNGTWTGTTTYNSTSGFVIGKYDVVAAWVGHLDGLVDEFTVTSDIITSGEVTTIYNSGAGIPYTEGGGGGVVKPQYLGFARL